jgi:hypothetical protein
MTKTNAALCDSECALNHDDAPDAVVAKINKLLSSHGLQLVHDEAVTSRVVYRLTSSLGEVEAQCGTVEEQIRDHARGHSRSFLEHWDLIPEDKRRPETLIFDAYCEGSAMTRVVLDSRARIAGVLAEDARQRLLRGVPTTTHRHTHTTSDPAKGG